MALLQIAVTGENVLREIAVPVRKFDRKLGKLLDDMAETMYKAEGVGIAAPQVAVSLRAIVINVGEGKHELVNPVIVESYGSSVSEEGCLSVPDYEGEVERFSRVVVKYQDRKGRKQSMAAEGLLSVCLQHEIDHLNGVLFIDKAKTLKPKQPKE